MFRLMVVTDRRVCRGALEEACTAALAGGADAIQLREKDLEGRELFRLAERLRRITADAGAALIVNHRVDVALAADADGVHLGWRSMSPEEVRAIAGDRLKMGLSCHTPADLEKAEAGRVDYALLGPVFPTPSKEGLVAPLGIERFAVMVRDAALPILGIGGITAENARDVRAAGACGVAVIRAVLGADDAAVAAGRLL